MFIRAHGTTSGIVHSIDIHPSRKHTCILAILGGSLLGTFLSEKGNLVLFQEENLNLVLLFILLTSAG
ncbi:Nuclear pore complex protein NUP43 [Camellia lanceoleosa]|nr:Nuclear pore complex protein NUP43 [Camellia lanceoleosa]